MTQYRYTVCLVPDIERPEDLDIVVYAEHAGTSRTGVPSIVVHGSAMKADSVPTDPYEVWRNIIREMAAAMGVELLPRM